MTPSIWILDDDESMRWVLERTFADNNWQVRMFSNAQDALDAFEHSAVADMAKPDVVLTDVRMPGKDGMALLKELQGQAPDLPIIVMTAHSDLDSAVSAFKGGAFEYLAKPFDLVDVLQVAGRAVNRAPETKSTARDAAEIPDKTLAKDIIGEAPAMQEVFRAIGRLARSSVSVLLTGASGTGKELVAHALHKHSTRADKPFVALNMAAIPAELIESELFGHAKGAFTGATHQRSGRFQQANGGTLFLDEIGDMPLAVQTRLLRVLAEGQFYPVGSHQLTQVDVRIIAATHKDLRKAVAEGSFREDLYHRLNVIHIRLPTLEERREDIAELAQHFLQVSGKELGIPPKRLSKSALLRLEQAQWPGNVRQLENTCRWLTVMAPGDEVSAVDLPRDIEKNVDEKDRSDWQLSLESALERAFLSGEKSPFKAFEDAFTESAIKIALKSTGGHRQNAAKLLGWGRNTLSRKLKS